MSSNQSWNNLGEQFKTVVQDALDSGDFRELNNLVNDTVSTVISEAGVQVKTVVDEVKKDVYVDVHKDMYSSMNRYQESQRRRNEQIQRDIQNADAARKEFRYQQRDNRVTGTYQSPTVGIHKTTLPANKVKHVGQVSSILYIVFGGIGTGLTALALLLGAVFGVVGFSWSTPMIIISVLVMAVFIGMIRKGVVENGRLSRMKRYIALCAGKMYINIEDLAQQANKSTKYILKDIKKMLKLGFFPEGHLDEKETCLMLDDATYREYLSLEKERKLLEQEEADKKQLKSQKQQMDSAVNAELQAMISEGQEYIRRLHELNDLIEGEVISNKMYRMESLLREIFERVEEHPEQMPHMHKLMSYYLPTTIKLFTAYEEFDNMSAPGEDVIAAKAQIEQTVDTINEAFEELLNKLFQNAVFDATTDAQVLQTMLAKDGLKKEFPERR